MGSLPDGVAQKSEAFLNNTDSAAAKKLGQACAEEFTQIFMEKFFVRFAERFTDRVAGKVAEMLMAETLAADRRAAERRAAEERKRKPKNKGVRKKMDKSPEITQELVFSELEKVVKEFQDALDSFRKNLATYDDPPLLLPPPISSPAMLPPPPIRNGTTTVDYDDDEVVEKRLAQLNFYHGQQHLELEQISEYEDKAMEYYPEWHDKISSTILQLSYRILTAVESYTEKLGDSPYGDGPDEDCVEKLRVVRQLQQEQK